MTVNELGDFTFENYYKQIGFAEVKSYYSIKRFEKRFFVSCSQINRKKCLILVMLKNIIYKKEKQNQ